MNSNKLKGIRIAKGYTQKQMAIKLGMAIRTYNRKELGIVEFNRAEIQKIAQILNLSLDEMNEIFFDNKLTYRLIN
ncbi:helix-turn-helix transcriptional regulator [Clostridium sp. D2Q-14]|uniref:helix-turn-helix transcriptional regulator n=1 Tax=Anaeromonas gelatinilytica TaxID=2683194 RepID=UPI00193C23FF|nr:helix-turn-helix transcriptional regulator [Anaeromonas gelatinilytica]MBS4534473.1 helix-turn-helix transcriptional regulator [Anaeromonas gelatinilytica]